MLAVGVSEGMGITDVPELSARRIVRRVPGEVVKDPQFERRSEEAFDGKHPRNEMREMDVVIPNADQMDPNALADRLGVTLEELPERLMEMKMSMERKVQEVQRFAEQFKTKPKNRAMRRAQKFGHSKLHY
jgi:hypothetical protein